MRRVAFFGIAWLLAPCVGAQSSSVSTRIETLVAPHARAELVSGVILVVRGDDIVFEGSYGFADFELRVPASMAHRFGIGSITKPMTAALVEMLVADERLSLDTPVAGLLEDFPRGPDGGVATIGHLLTHHAGVPHRVTEAVEETLPLRTADIVDRVRRQGLLFDPGAQRLYSSAGYTCLARVIEILEQEPFESVLARRVFAPARMASATSETGQELMPMRARPHRLGAADGEIVVAHAPYKDLRFLTGAGSVYATAWDLVRFVRAIRAGVYGDGVAASTFDGDPATWQGIYGRTNGYEASVDVLLERDIVFVFVSNLQSASNWQIRAAVRNLLVGTEAASVPLPPAVRASFEPAEALVGHYGRVDSPAVIAIVDDKLFRGDNEFYPIDGERYYIPGSGTIMRFRRDATGSIDALISLGSGGRESVLPRLEP